MLKKHMHTSGAQVLKSVHPAAKMCTQGVGCTLNFEHCLSIVMCMLNYTMVITGSSS